MPRWAYILALRLLLPFAVLWFLWRGWRNHAYYGRLREPLALGIKPRVDRPVWLHAASVGEAQALGGLLRGLLQLPAPPPVLLTVGTPTGLARAREHYRDLPQLTLQLAPWDLPGIAARFLRVNRPRAAVFIETELWPGQIAACAVAGVPLALVSARMSPRSLGRYQRWAPRLMQEAVRTFAAIGAQSEADRDRFIALGAAPARVQTTGNLKFDFRLPADVREQGDRLRDVWAAERPLWVAGSTHAVEEGICIDAQRQLVANARAQQRAVPLLLLAPRRPERFAEVARWLTTQGLKFARISEGEDALTRQVDVLLLDAMGALLGWYAAADVTFVGGSLVPVGGHNLLEPAALGKPLLAGPHSFNTPDATRLLATAGALTTVANADELARAVEGFLTDAARAQRSGGNAVAVVAANRGAAERALAMIAALPPAA
ncbi:MAG: 3-deoxy-D-manno-octulosonic acid transferase [Steroidobacteraceae bacterium]